MTSGRVPSSIVSDENKSAAAPQKGPRQGPSGPSAAGPSAAGPSAARPIRPRSIDLPLERIARSWMAGNVVSTAIANSVNMLFPAGERFFVRSVRHYLPTLPAELRERVLGFFGQEGRHAQAHERVNSAIADSGYHVEGFLRLYERVCYGGLERISPPALRLAATAACEHFTAIMADNFLSQEAFVEGLDPTMRRLLQWHAAEEIEHKSVAYDVLNLVAPSYAMRVAGMALASAMLGLFWLLGTGVLLTQDVQQLGWRRVLEDLQRLRQFRRETQHQGIVQEVFARGINEYLQRDFHPDALDNYELARQLLEQAGL